MENKKIENQSHRLHLLWIPYTLIKSIKEFILLFLALILYLGTDTQHKIINYLIFIIILFLIYKCISTFLEWFNFKYIFSDIELFVAEGRFIRRKKFISIKKIKGIKQITPFFHRIFGLTSLIVDTGATGKDSTVVLGMIKLEEANRIQEKFIQKSNIKAKLSQNQNILDISKNTAPNESIFYQISLKEILIASLTSLSFLIFLSLIYSIYTNTRDFIKIDTYIDKIFLYFTNSWLSMISGILIILILSLLYGTFKTYISYRNFQISDKNNRIHIRKGLLNLSEFSIPKENIEAIIFNTKLLKRFLKIVEVKIISTGDDNGKEIKTSNILFPFIKRERALKLTSKLLPNILINKNMKGLSVESFVIKLIRIIFLWLISISSIFLIIQYINVPQYLKYVIGIILFLITLTHLLNYKYTKHSIHSDYFQIQSGSISINLFITTHEKIEQIKITQSGLQKMFHLSNLEVYTKSNSLRVLKVKDIKKREALAYAQWFTKRI